MKQNTKEEAIALNQKITELISQNKIFKLTFFDERIVDVKILKMKSKIDETNFYCTLYTFCDNILDIVEYDIYILKDVN